jgi:CheY-like chemotaxis protein
VSDRPLVLVADDDPDILNLVTLRLERDGQTKTPFSTTDLRSRVQAALGR